MSLQLVEELLAAAAGVLMGAETGIGPTERRIFELTQILGRPSGQPRVHDVPGSGQGPEHHQADPRRTGKEGRDVPAGSPGKDDRQAPEYYPAEPSFFLGRPLPGTGF